MLTAHDGAVHAAANMVHPALSFSDNNIEILLVGCMPCAILTVVALAYVYFSYLTVKL